MPDIEMALPFSTVSATALAATAVTVTLPAASSVRALYFLAASVSVADSGPVTLKVANGATTLLNLDLALTVGVPYVLQLPAGLAGAPNVAMVVTLSAPAATSIGKLTVGTDTL